MTFFGYLYMYDFADEFQMFAPGKIYLGRCHILDVSALLGAIKQDHHTTNYKEMLYLNYEH